MGMDVIAQLARAAGGARNGHRPVASPLTAIASMAKIAAVVDKMEKEAAPGVQTAKNIYEGGKNLFNNMFRSGPRTAPVPAPVPAPAAAAAVARPSIGLPGGSSTDTLRQVNKSLASQPTNPLLNTRKLPTASPTLAPAVQAVPKTPAQPFKITQDPSGRDVFTQVKGWAPGKWAGRAAIPVAGAGGLAAAHQLGGFSALGRAIGPTNHIQDYAGAQQAMQHEMGAHDTHMDILRQRMAQIDQGTYQPSLMQKLTGWNPTAVKADYANQLAAAERSKADGNFGNMAKLKQQQLDAQAGLQSSGQELGGARRMLSSALTGEQMPHSTKELNELQRQQAAMYGLDYDKLMTPVPQPAAPERPGQPAPAVPGDRNQIVYPNSAGAGKPLRPGVGSEASHAPERPNPRDAYDYSGVAPKGIYGQ